MRQSDHESRANAFLAKGVRDVAAFQEAARRQAEEATPEWARGAKRHDVDLSIPEGGFNPAGATWPRLIPVPDAPEIEWSIWLEIQTWRVILRHRKAPEDQPLSDTAWRRWRNEHAGSIKRKDGSKFSREVQINLACLDPLQEKRYREAVAQTANKPPN